MKRNAVGSALAVVLVAVLVVATRSEGKMGKSEGLTVKQQRIVPIAAFTASGDQRKLRMALAEGLDAGWTVNELKEVLVQMYAYAGFPRSLNALNTFIERSNSACSAESSGERLAWASGGAPCAPGPRQNVKLLTRIGAKKAEITPLRLELVKGCLTHC